MERAGPAEGLRPEFPRLARVAYLGLDLHQGEANRPVAVDRGGKILAGGKLTFDAAQGRYQLEGTEAKPGGGPIAFAGALDASGKTLVLDQVGHDSGAGRRRGTIRLSIWPNANFIRYTMSVDRKDPGDVQFSRTIEVGLTKEGESLAAGASSSERPKCIVTGGAATMTLTYQGRTFQICCTGCRDEFNENPEKYIKKASLLAQAEGAQPKSGPSPARVSRSEDAFASDVDDAPAMKGKRPAAGASPKAAKADPAPDPDDDEATSSGTGKSATGKAAEKPAASQSSTRAAGLLQVGQNLEKSGKSSAALGYYKRIVKDFPTRQPRRRPSSGSRRSRSREVVVPPGSPASLAEYDIANLRGPGIAQGKGTEVRLRACERIG